jgi:hypothetical protein
MRGLLAILLLLPVFVTLVFSNSPPSMLDRTYDLLLFRNVIGVDGLFFGGIVINFISGSMLGFLYPLYRTCNGQAVKTDLLRNVTPSLIGGILLGIGLCIFMKPSFGIPRGMFFMPSVFMLFKLRVTTYFMRVSRA